MPMNSSMTLEWTVVADASIVGTARIEVTAEGVAPVMTSKPLIFFPDENGPPELASQRFASTATGDGKAKTYYIDSMAGNNANAGTSAETAWKDFTNINGKTLGPGEKLLLRGGGVASSLRS